LENARRRRFQGKCSPKGCEKVADGHRPPDNEAREFAPWKGARDPVENLAPLQGAALISVLSGGLRCASTTGYFLSTLRVEELKQNWIERQRCGMNRKVTSFS
jgi:hypothetical protein